MCPRSSSLYRRSGLGGLSFRFFFTLVPVFQGTSAKTTLLETTLPRTPEKSPGNSHAVSSFLTQGRVATVRLWFGCGMVRAEDQSQFLGRGCDEALLSEKKGFSVKRGEAIQ